MHTLPFHFPSISFDFLALTYLTTSLPPHTACPLPSEPFCGRSFYVQLRTSCLLLSNSTFALIISVNYHCCSSIFFCLLFNLSLIFVFILKLFLILPFLPIWSSFIPYFTCFSPCLPLFYAAICSFLLLLFIVLAFCSCSVLCLCSCLMGLCIVPAYCTNNMCLSVAPNYFSCLVYVPAYCTCLLFLPIVPAYCSC